MPAKRLAFIKRGQWSHINASVAEMLTGVFPEYEVDTITLRDLEYTGVLEAPRRVGSRLLNRCYAIKEFRGPILSGRKRLTACLPRTTYAFRKHKEAIAKYLAAEDYAFTFQTQNLFDAKIEGIPHFVYTDHCNLATLQYPGYTKADLWSDTCVRLETSVYRNAAFVFTSSDNIADWLVENYPISSDKVACVHAGSNARSAVEEPSDIGRYARKRILFVGTWWEAKGGPVMLEAFSNVLKVHPDAHLTIVGSSPVVDVPNCTVAGRVPVTEVGRYYADASIFCLPTQLEAFGISFVEAMAHRLPVIGTRLGAIPEFISDGSNGYLVTPGDVAALTDRLIRLLDDPLLCKTFGDKGYRVASESFTWESVGLKIREHIDRVIA